MLPGEEGASKERRGEENMPQTKRDSKQRLSDAVFLNFFVKRKIRNVKHNKTKTRAYRGFCSGDF